MKLTFPTSLIELHQWANTALLAVVVFFVVETYKTIKADHEQLVNHEMRIVLVEKLCCDGKTALNTNSRNSIANNNRNSGTD